MTLDTHEFIKAVVSEGYSQLCVVPCSFAKNVINAAINSTTLEYIPCASEAVACSIAAGLKMAGKKPIVIVQSSGITNMGSCITSLLKPYDITFPIMVSWRTYSEGSSEIQHMHLATELPKLVNAYGYTHIILDNNNIDTAIRQINTSNTSASICLIPKDTFSKVDLEKKHILELGNRTPRSKFLERLNTFFKESDTLFIGTTGNTAREMYTYMPDTNNFYMAGNMGGALSLGLGAAKAGKNVVVCGGDAEFVMHMGGLTTAGRYQDSVNMLYILFDNESNKSTGGQNTYQSHVNYIEIAKHANLLTYNTTIHDLNEFSAVIKKNMKQEGLQFICVKCGYDEVTPRPPLDIVKINQFKN